MTTPTNQLQQIMELGMRETGTQNLKILSRHLGIISDEWRKILPVRSADDF